MGAGAYPSGYSQAHFGALLVAPWESGQLLSPLMPDPVMPGI